MFTRKFVITALKITCFGDSNVKRHQDLLENGILSKNETTFVLTYTIDSLKENLFCITGEEDYIIIHILTNDIKYICHNQPWKSVSERKNDLNYLAYNFAIMIRKLIAKYPTMKIIISMILPRFDEKDLLEMFSNGKKRNFYGNEIINDELSKQLLEVENVIMIENGDIEEMDFVEDKFHLSKGGFEKMCMKWRTEIGTKYLFSKL